MAGRVNLSTHGSELKKAYQAVLDSNSSSTYCIFGYDKGTNDLKVVEEGDGDLEDFIENFEDGLLLYGFIRITDPNTNLPKFIFVSWCGEGVPMFKKGSFPGHLGDVMAFMKGYHIHIDARDESDISPQQIMKRVNESGGAKYSYHEQAKQSASQPPAPSKPRAPPVVPTKSTISVRSTAINNSVPTNPSISNLSAKPQPLARVDTPIPPLAPSPVDDRIAPVRSLGYQKVSLPRPKPLQNRFLEQAAQAERERQEEAARERERRDKEYQDQIQAQLKQDKFKQQEEFRKLKEQEELNLQAQQNDVERERELAQEQDRQRQLEEEQKRMQQEQDEYERQQREAEEQAEYERQEREAQEAAEQERLQQEQAEYERQQREADEAAEQERLRHEQEEYERQQREAEEQAEYERQEREAQEAAEQERLQQEQAEYERQQREAEEQERLRQEEEEAQRAAEEQALLDQQAAAASELTYQEPAQPSATQAESGHLTAIALYDYTADDDNELTLKEGEMVTNIQQLEEGWWHGVNESNESGIFPSNYVEVVDSLPTEMESLAQPQTNGHVEDDQPLDELPVAIALYDYVGADETEISFAMDQYIYDIEFISDDWWQGSLDTGDKGVFPANYVKLVDQ